MDAIALYTLKVGYAIGGLATVIVVGSFVWKYISLRRKDRIKMKIEKVDIAEMEKLLAVRDRGDTFTMRVLVATIGKVVLNCTKVIDKLVDAHNEREDRK